MIVRMKLVTAAFWALANLSAATGLAQTHAQMWTLPRSTTVQDAGPRTWHFTVDYNTASPTGALVQRQRVTGDYTRGLPDNQVEWHNVTKATASGATAPFAAAEKIAFMEGFRYRDDVAGTLAPDFFQSFPAAAVLERNLVWDTGMFESFGQNYFDQLQLNVPLHVGSDQDVRMPDVGTFHNRDIVLEWVGRSERNGQDCAVILYRAFFNPLDLATGPMTLKGRSDYWGEIWVSLTTKQIEFATVYEEVSGQMKLPGQDSPQPLNVFRIGSFEPVAAK